MNSGRCQKYGNSFLYNESLFFRHRLKIIAKKIAGKNIGGPQAVLVIWDTACDNWDNG